MTGSSVDVDDVRPHIQNAMQTAAALTELNSTSEAQDGEEPRVLTFTELKELIEQGKTDQIPNNRVIPNVLSVR